MSAFWRVIRESRYLEESLEAMSFDDDLDIDVGWVLNWKEFREVTCNFLVQGVSRKSDFFFLIE